MVVSSAFGSNQRLNPSMPRRLELVLITLILILAAGLRFYRLGDLPPGWRDDEIVETTVHAQLVLAGHFPLYFSQAEGHEPLFHYLSAGWIALVGRNLLTVRLLSAFFGLLSVAALYRFTRRAFGPIPALLGALGLAISFWGLMYARFKLRHIGMVAFMLLAFEAWGRSIWRWPSTISGRKAPPSPLLLCSSSPWLPRSLAPIWPSTSSGRVVVISALYLTLAFYTYFAARALPLILLAWLGYLLLFHFKAVRAQLAAWGVGASAYALLCVPLLWAIAQLPSGEARLSVVGGPLQALVQGDLGPALINTRDTLGMFAFTGDPEYLYNIPHRPVFEAVGATLFLGGVLLAVWRWRDPRYAFLLIWLLGGIAPAFVSVPAASLGHTIVAQPVVYIFPALAIAEVLGWLRHVRASPIPVGWWALALSSVPALFFISTALRDWGDYFLVWPTLPEVRFLYRAHIHEAAPALQTLPLGSAVVLESRLLHPADVLAVQLEAPSRELQPRLYQPPWARFFPNQAVPLLLENATLTTTLQPAPLQPATALTATFSNGWQLTGYTLALDTPAHILRLDTYWHITPAFTPPPLRPVENLAGTPLPLKLFTHLLAPSGEWVAGDDRLNVDPATLRAGDEFVQRFELQWPAGLVLGQYAVALGLYDPQTGERVTLVDGADHVNITEVNLP